VSGSFSSVVGHPDNDFPADSKTPDKSPLKEPVLSQVPCGLAIPDVFLGSLCSFLGL